MEPRATEERTRTTAERRRPTATRAVLAASGVLTGGLWLVLAADLPWLQRLPSWFWPLTADPRPQPGWFLLGFAGFATAVAIAWRGPRRRYGAATLLLFVGLGLQWCYALVEGRGHQALRDHMISAGHTAFLRQAVAEESIGELARDYAKKIERGELPAYPFATKPPGFLVAYMLHERVTGVLPNRHGDREARAVTTATVVFPLGAAAAALPWLWLGARRTRRRAGPAGSAGSGRLGNVELAAFLYLTIPAVLLITLHLDQALLPLVAAVVYVLGARAVAAPSSHGRLALVLAGAAGAIAALSCFLSYTFVAVLMLGAALIAAPAGLELARAAAAGSPDGLSARGALRRRAVLLAAYAGGATTGLVGLRWALGFDVALGLKAIDLHREWKIERWDLPTTLTIGLVDLVELAVWTGPPVFALAVLGCWRSTVRLVSRRSPASAPRDDLGVALLVTVLVLAFAGRTAGEVARLWLFLQPLIAFVAAGELAQLCSSSRRRIVPMAAVMTVQLVHAAALKLWMDFV